MQERASYDGALKEMFERERPTILRFLCPGAKVLEPVNVELTEVKHRRVDLLFLVDDASLLHLEFQGSNEFMGLRQAEYFLLIKAKHPDLPLKQVVLYFGQPTLSMEGRWACDGMEFHFEVMDIRSIDARELMATGNWGDLVLATLAGGGADVLGEAIARVLAMTDKEAQNRLLTQILMLAGLRGTHERITMEVKSMALELSERTNPFLAALGEKRWGEGLAEGRLDGERRGLRRQIVRKFGSVPAWAEDRLATAGEAELDQWLDNILTADSVEAVLRAN